jgi:hypothetical protein
LPISAVDTITLAFQHTKRQLLQPFRFGQWTRLAFVGLLAGEMGSSGCHVPSNFNLPQHAPSSRQFFDPGFGGGFGGLDGFDPAMYAGLIAVIVAVAVVFAVIMMYLNSVMRFILFDSVLAKECHIRAGWSRRQGPAWKYFFWQLGYLLATFAALAIFVGIPAAFALALGWFKQPGDHVLGWVLGGIFLFFFVLIFLVVAIVVQVMTKDFVVPQMALDGVGPIEGWQRLWPMMQAEKGGYAAYIGMKVVLAIGAGIVIGIASVFLGLIIAIPTIGLGLVAVITGKTAGLTWNVYTITIAVVVGCVLFAIFFYLLSLLAVPAIVFFPAYSIYFFAARYRALNLALYPPPPPLPPGIPPNRPPEIPPPPLLPEPVG